MARWSRYVVALLLCGVGVVLGPVPTATAAPPVDVGVGTVIADLGVVTESYRPGFSFDGAYYAYLVPTAGACDLHVYDVAGRKQVDLASTRIVCDSAKVQWAGHSDTLVWQVVVRPGLVTEYAWDARPGRVTTLATDAEVLDKFANSTRPSISADGRFLAFTGRSATRPAPAIDDPADAWYVFDRSTGISVPLSTTDRHVQFSAWAPAGDAFVAAFGGHSVNDGKDGSCFGSENACRSFATDQVPTLQWSPDGTAVAMSHPNGIHDFTSGSTVSFPKRADKDDYEVFLGNDRVVASNRAGGAVWNRRTGKVLTIAAPGPLIAPGEGRHLLYPDPQPDAYRYVNVVSGASALATFRGTGARGALTGYWTEDGSTYLGVGTGGCTTLKQWSPATNTVNLFRPSGPLTCYRVPNPSDTGPQSSASGRFAAIWTETQNYATGFVDRAYVADLRRHVLLGPLQGGVEAFAPAGSDVMAVGSDSSDEAERLLLVDATPVPDVDDKPRWSASTPANGARVEVAEGGHVTVRLGASVLQRTPVYLAYRWRNGVNVPVASAPPGWSCDSKRAAGGAIQADCTFTPPHDHAAPRFLDVWAVNSVTGAQGDTRSYRVKTL